jgi:hypothetical protein
LTLRHLIHKLVHASPSGLAGLLDYLNIGRTANMGVQTLSNKINFNSTSHTLNVQEAEQVLDYVDGNFSAAEYFASKCQAVVFRLPEQIDGDMALLDLFMDAMRELGEVSAEFQKAYADGRITMLEFAQIAKEIDDVIAKLIAFKCGVERVVIG